MPYFVLEIGLIVAGVFLIARELELTRMASAIRGRLKMTGTITGYHRSSTSSADSLWVDYVYSVAGIEYQRAFAHKPSQTYGHEQLKARYPVGAQIEVTYRVDNPSSAIVEADRRASWLITLCGIAVLGAGAFFLAKDFYASMFANHY